MLTANVPDDDVGLNIIAQVAFLQRMVPTWFMRPFTSNASGAIEQGNANESQVIRILRKRVRKISSGLYSIGKVEEFSLLASAQLPFPLLLALNHLTNHTIVIINTGNGDGESTIRTVCQWGGG